jgi:hypothetical protein
MIYAFQQWNNTLTTFLTWYEAEIDTEHVIRVAIKRTNSKAAKHVP